MTYDSARGRVVLFGGLGWPTVFMDDTWVLDGSDWQELASRVSPSARVDHAMAYDAARDRVVLFGGWNVHVGMLADTWEWDGAAWQQRTPANAPPPCAMTQLVFDAVRARTVLFGGWTGAAPLDQTWEWDGTEWSRRFPTHSPSPRYDHSMVWDAARHRVLLYGGRVGTTLLGGTWEWDGTDWSRRGGILDPMLEGAVAFDVARGVAVLTARRGVQTIPNETWEWNGTEWTRVQPAAPLPMRTSHEMVHDASRTGCVVFGGNAFDGYQGAYLDDTWVFQSRPAGHADYVTFGRGCPGSAGVPELLPNSLPWLGRTLDLEVRNIPPVAPCFVMCGFSTTAHWVLPLPAELSSFWMPGCTLDTDIVGWYLASPAGDQAQVGIPLPALPQLVGTTFFQQALVRDPLANARGFVTSNAGAAMLGTPSQ